MKKILLVDDQAENIRILSEILNSFIPDCNILQTLDAEAAVRIAMKEIPDLIITDWEMPNTNGIDLIKFLQSDELTNKIPIIVVTGVMLTTENLSLALKTGATDFVRKPVIASEIQARIASIFRTVELFKKDKEQQELILKNEAELADLRARELLSQLENEKKVLAAISLQLVRNTELGNQMIEELKNVIPYCDNEGKEKLYQVIKKYNQTINDDSWEQFEKQFTALHHEFEQKLMEKFPNLTSNDKRLCAMLRLNMSTKDIAHITHGDINSINVARTRLRKKLGLERDENLNIFLSGL